MKDYYKLVRQEEIVPILQSRLLEDKKWQDQLKEKIPTHAYSLSKGFGEQKKNIILNELPPAFLLQQERLSLPLLLPSLTSSIGLGGAILAAGLLGGPLLKALVSTHYQDGGNDQCVLVCNLRKLNPESAERILQALDIFEYTKDNQQKDLHCLLADFADKTNSVLRVAPQYVSKNFPLTYSEEMIYDSIFTQHPLVGYEHMLVPLEKYYKFLSEQSFNEFLTILVRLGAKKVELIHSENKLMKNALNAYGSHYKAIEASGIYAETSTESSHSYWGMEFEGRQISPKEISNDFLNQFPFHRNNGTLKAMIEGIKSGNRNKIYTVERSFTGSYGLDMQSAIKILGFEAGFSFNKEVYNDEKSTFNVLY